MFDDLIPDTASSEQDPFADLIPTNQDPFADLIPTNQGPIDAARTAADDIGLKLNIGATVAIPEQVGGLSRAVRATSPLSIISERVTPQFIKDWRDGVEDTIDTKLNDRRKQLSADMSPEQKASDKKQYFTDESSWSNLAKEGIGAVPGKVVELAQEGKLFGEGWTDWRKVTGSVAESLPGTLLTMGPTAKVAGTAGKEAYEAALASTGSEVAAKAAAQKAAERTAMVVGGAAEGMQGAGGAYTQTRREVMEMPIEKLQASPFFQEQLGRTGGCSSSPEARR